VEDEQPGSRPTAEAITAVIAERVRTLRDRAGLSQSDLAERMVELGIQWKRPTVVNLEKRAPSFRTRKPGPGRDAVTVQELIGLALALDVPPTALLVDLGSAAPVPLTPRVPPVDPWRGLRWLLGDRALPADVAVSGTEWHDESRRIRWGLRAMQLTEALERRAKGILEDAAAELEPAAAPGTAAAGRQQYKARQLAEDTQLARDLKTAVWKARDLGLPVPALPDQVLQAMEALGNPLEDDDGRYRLLLDDEDAL
jgi:transcriptional regulator with XRE-family HTH domain